MKTLTQYGVDNLQILLGAFTKLGQDILGGEISEEIKPVNEKNLRMFRMKEASLMVGRSDAYLRNLEKEDPSFIPDKKNNIRYYTLELINRIRDKAGTRIKRPPGSSPIILASTNFKGGVTKTTTIKNLADKAGLNGLRVLTIGLDGQGTDALYYGMIPDLDISPEETIGPALLDNPALIKSIIKNTYFDGIDIIPGNLTLTQVEMKLTDYREQMNQVKKLGFPDERLATALGYIKEDYDVILLDCGPNLNILTLNAINACNAMLIPVPPALPDLASFGTYCKTLREHLEYSGKKKSLEFFRVLIAKHPKNKVSENISKTIIKEFGSYVMPRSIVYSAEIEFASSNFCSLYELPPSSKKTYKRAMESMESVFNEVLDAIKMIWEAQSMEANQNA